MCAETTTVNFGWTKPDPGASANTWGTTLNATTDKIDDVAWRNQQASAPIIGSIIMFGGTTAPAGWLICDGRSLSTAAPYDKLFAVLQYAFGGAGLNFNLPNLSGVFPLGAGTSNPVGQAAGSYSVTIDLAHLPAHAHPITDVTHSHTAYQSGHSHNLIISDHAHTFAEWATNSSGVGVPVRSDVSNYWQTYQTANTSTQHLSGNTDTQTPPVGVNPMGTGLSTTVAVGGGAALSIIPQYVALNFIVRYT